MKKFSAFIFSFLMIGFSAIASVSAPTETMGRGYDGNAYIFVEGGVEFSVFPDGQFDFVHVGGNQGSTVSVSVGSPNVNVSFNSGYDYEMYVQYDDYGAVVQVENVPIYYDEFGRIVQAGNVDIHYNDRRVVRVGGLHVFYDTRGYFTHYTGFINYYNPYYVYQPWHVYYARPIFSSCIVYDYPYRRYYSPHRYSWNHHHSYYKNRHKVAYSNGRRDFHRPGSRVHHKDGRVAVNKDYNPNRRNTAVAQNNDRENMVSRNNYTGSSRATTVAKGNSTSRGIAQKDDKAVRNNNIATERGTAVKNNKNSRSVNNTNSTTSRNVAVKNSRPTLKNESSNVTQREVPKNETRVQPVKRQSNSNSVSRNTNTNVKRNTAPAPKNESVSRNSSSRSNTAINRGSSNTSSRGSAVKSGNSSRGGRG